MKLRKGHVRITAGDHLGKITMHNAEATEKVRCFRGEQGIGRGLSDQLINGGAVPGAGFCFLDQSGNAIRAPVRVTSLRP